MASWFSRRDFLPAGLKAEQVELDGNTIRVHVRSPDLQDRLDQFSQRGKSKRRGNSLGVGAIAAALALGGAGVAYFLATGLQEGDSALETSDVETFQDRRPGTGGWQNRCWRRARSSRARRRRRSCH